MKTAVKEFLIFILVTVPVLSMGQEHKVSGTVVAFNKFPLSNISVKAKKAKTEAVTDDKGQFEIEIRKNDIIQIEEPEFVEYNKRISGRDKDVTINLIIRNNEKDMERVVEKGYIAKEDLDYGRERLWSYNNEFGQFTDIYEAIHYAIPEAMIVLEGDQRGVRFRGHRSFYGSNLALILVNGVITEDVSFIIPADVISITRLSSSQAAIYGSRGSNGVVEIKTR